MGKINVAIVGVGNCASSLVQGVHYYGKAKDDEFVPGLMHVNLGGYHISDINFVAAFDIDLRKRERYLRLHVGPGTASTFGAVALLSRGDEMPGSDDGSVASGAVLAVPLRLRGQVVGTLSLHETQEHRSWSSEEMALAEAVAEQVALTVENLRLMDETQRRAIRERAIREITDQMQRAVDMEALMCITAEELNRVMGGTGAYVHLGVDVQRQDEIQTSDGNGRETD